MAEKGEKSTEGEKSSMGEMSPILLGIPLTYDGSSGVGTLTDLDVGALVDYGNPTVESSRFSMTHSHRNSLTCYIATGGKEDRIAVYEEAPIALGSCFEELGPSIKEYLIPANDENGALLPIGELHSSTYIPNRYRRIIGDMVRYVSHLHSHGKSISNGVFLEHNLRYKDGKVMYFGLNLIEPDQKSQSQSQKRDFLYVSRAVKSVIQRANKLNNKLNLAKPPDFQNLVTLMDNFNPSNRSLINSHLAILTTGERNTRIKRFSETESMTVLQKGNFSTALKAMTKSNWTSRFTTTNSRRLGPANDCFWYGAFQNENGRIIPTYNGTNKSLIRYCRNLVEHANQHFSKYDNPCGGDFTLKHYELIAMALFSQELLSFQQAASGYDIYEKFFLQYT